MLITAIDEIDALDPADALGGQRRNEVGEAAAQIGHDDVGAVQWSGARDDGGVVEVALPESALGASQALAVDLNGGPHLAQGPREAEAVLVHGLVNDGQALGLGERHHQGLLPVGHETGVDVGLHHDAPQIPARVIEADAVVAHVEGAADLAEGVEEGRHIALVGAANEDVALSGQRGGCPGGRLDAVRQGGVVVTGEVVDALDMDGAIGIDRDDGTHLLQDIDEVENLGLDRRSPQFGQALGAYCRQQCLLGRADGRVGQIDDRAMQALGSGDAYAALELVHDRPVLAQNLQVEVDRAVPDAAAAQIGDEGLPQTVQEWAAEQNGDAGAAGVGVDIGHVSGLDAGRIQPQDALGLVIVDRHTVKGQQPRDDVDVTDERNVAQDGGRSAQQGRNHRLGYEILRPTHRDLTVERASALNLEQSVDHQVPPKR